MLNELYQTIIDEDISEWRKHPRACVYTTDGHFKHLI